MSQLVIWILVVTAYFAGGCAMRGFAKATDCEKSGVNPKYVAAVWPFTVALLLIIAVAEVFENVGTKIGNWLK